jgi:hypothetical protein
MPMGLFKHAMVQLGNGQAIIGGAGDEIIYENDYSIQSKIHLLNCMNRNCSISTLSQELSVPREYFLAIPLPDTIVDCITGGKKFSKKVPDSFVIISLFSPKLFQSASWLLLLETDTATTTPTTCIVNLTEETAVDRV